MQILELFDEVPNDWIHFKKFWRSLKFILLDFILIITSSLSTGKVSENEVNSVCFFESRDPSVGFCTVPIGMHFLPCNIFPLPNIRVKCKGCDTFQNYYWAYHLVSSTTGCTTAISKMFLNAFMTSTSPVSNWEPYTLQKLLLRW